MDIIKLRVSRHIMHGVILGICHRMEFINETIFSVFPSDYGKNHAMLKMYCEAVLEYRDFFEPLDIANLMEQSRGATKAIEFAEEYLTNPTHAKELV